MQIQFLRKIQIIKFKPNRQTLVLFVSGIVALNSYAHAQEATEDVNAADENTTDINILTVTGFRRSVAESINSKRFTNTVVESISAEDIGKLPDSSIAESIARLPGLAAQREDGRASRISIRGFGENESGTTFNGREQVSISDNRGVEFDLYPSEIMSAVTVYKTSTAELEGEGIAGIIDMQTVKPLLQNERIIQFNGQYEQTSFEKLNPDGEDSGARGTFFYLDKCVNDTVGVAFAYSSMESPSQEKRWYSWGYPSLNVDGTDYSVLGGAKPFVRSSNLERDSLMLVVEYAPTNDLKMSFDILDVDFLDTKKLRGIEIPYGWGQGSISWEAIDEATGFVTQGLTEGQRAIVHNDFNSRKADLQSFGFNSEYTVNETWTLEYEASYSQVERNLYNLESYSGTGRGDTNGVADNIGYTFNMGNAGATFTHDLDYSDYDLIQLGGPLTWGWSSALNNHYGITGTPLENHAQDGFVNTPSIDDELTSLKLAATQETGTDVIPTITYGIAYKERNKSKDSDGFYVTLSSFPDNPGMLPIPEQYRLGTVSLDFIGMGDMIAYNTMGLVNDGYYDFLSEKLTNQKHITRSWQVTEEVTSAFISADMNTKVADMALTGNFGLRYIHTSQSSHGAASSIADGLVITSPTFISHEYSHLLPSLNLSLAIDDEQNFRFGVAQTISRARLDEMNASLNVSYNQIPDENGNNWSVDGGNPALEPKEATGIDLTYENYFNQEGYFTISYFYKDLNSWIFNGNYLVDMTGVEDPLTGLVPESPMASGSGKVNGGGGDLSGIELSITLPLNMFAESLDGFGVITSHTSISSDIKDPNGNKYKLPGLSDSIQTFTLYYEKYGFQARASMRKRDDFKGDAIDYTFSTVQVDILGETIWDAQIGYNFGEAGYDGLQGLSVFFQAQNLTEEPFTSLRGDSPLHVRDYQDYGSTYLLGFSYKLK